MNLIEVQENPTKVCNRKDDIVLKLKKTLDTQMLCWDSTRFCLTTNGKIVLYGVCEEDMALYSTIHLYNCQGELERTLCSPTCDHDDGYHGITEVVTNDNKYIGVSCAHKDCKAITLCGTGNQDIPNDDDVTVAHKGPRRGLPSPGAMCMGEDNTLFCVQCIEGSYSLCVFDCSTTQFEIKDILPMEVDVPCYICYVKHHSYGGIVVVSKWNNFLIAASSIMTRRSLWRLKGKTFSFKKNPFSKIACLTFHLRDLGFNMSKFRSEDLNLKLCTQILSIS